MQNFLRRAGLQLALLVGLGLTLGACNSIPQPAQEWVTASRQIHDVVAPRFAAYVENDPLLEARPDDKLTLLELLEDWDLMIQEGEAIYPPAAAEGGDE